MASTFLLSLNPCDYIFGQDQSFDADAMRDKLTGRERRIDDAAIQAQTVGKPLHRPSQRKERPALSRARLRHGESSKERTRESVRRLDKIYGGTGLSRRLMPAAPHGARRSFYTSPVTPDQPGISEDVIGTHEKGRHFSQVPAS